MRLKPSMYLTGGFGFALGALLFTLSAIFHPVPPAFGALTAHDLAWWKVTTLGFYMGAALTLTGQIALSRHFATTDQDGWGQMALAMGVVGAIGYLGATSVEYGLYANGVENAGAGAWGAAGMAAAGRIVAWSSIIVGGLALSRDRGFPRLLGPAGILIGAVQILGEIVIAPNDAELRLLWLVGFGWLFAVGFVMVRRRAALASGAAAAPVMAHA